MNKAFPQKMLRTVIVKKARQKFQRQEPMIPKMAVKLAVRKMTKKVM